MDDRFGKAPLKSGYILFTRPDAQEEWNAMNAEAKAFVVKNLAAAAKKMEAEIAIEMLCHVINDLVKRIEDLENEKN